MFFLKIAGYHTKRLMFTFAGYTSQSISESITLRAYSKIKRGVNQDMHADDIYIFADSCRKVYIPTGSAVEISAVAHYRQKCLQKFGSIDVCDGIAVSNSCIGIHHTKMLVCNSSSSC